MFLQLKVVLQRISSVEAQLAVLQQQTYPPKVMRTIGECTQAVSTCSTIMVKLEKSVRMRSGHERLANPGNGHNWVSGVVTNVVAWCSCSCFPGYLGGRLPQVFVISCGVVLCGVVRCRRVLCCDAEIVELEEAVKNSEGYVAIAIEEARKSGAVVEVGVFCVRVYIQ